MKLTTTLNFIRSHSPCREGYRKLVNRLGGIEAYGADTEINLLTILESNGVQDMLWCLRATQQDSKKIASQLAIGFAEECLPIFEARYLDDKRPRDCIQACKDYTAGIITLEQLREKRRAAYAAAGYAVYAADAAADAAAAAHAAYAADAGYADAGYADAAHAAHAAAAHAAAAHADADAARERQADIIRGVLTWG